MNDHLKRDFYIKHLAQHYRLYESTLYRELEAILGDERRVTREDPARRREVASAEIRAVEIPGEGNVPQYERALIRAMIEGGSEVVKRVFDQIGLSDFTHACARDLAGRILHYVEEGKPVDASTLINDVEEEPVRRLLAEVVFSRHQISKGWIDEGIDIQQASPLTLALDALHVMRRRVLEKNVEENQRLLDEASRMGGDIGPLLTRYRDLLEELKHIEMTRGRDVRRAISPDEIPDENETEES